MIQRDHGALRRRSVLDHHGPRIGSSMTPMVDVVLVILIFFMGSATIVGHEWFLRAQVAQENALSKADQPGSIALPVPVIETTLRVNGSGVRVFGLAPGAIGVDEAAAMIGSLDLGADPGSLVVVVTGEDEVPMGAVSRIHDAWQARGVSIRMR